MYYNSTVLLLILFSFKDLQDKTVSSTRLAYSCYACYIQPYLVSHTRLYYLRFRCTI